MKKEVESHLLITLSTIGMDKPHNFDEIVDFCVNDIKETASKDWHSGDVAIALRRFIESKSETP